MRERVLAGTPRLVPVYAHRYIPDAPSLAGNPVFSVYGADMIVYGRNLEEYLENEFHVDLGQERGGPVREIAFWSRLMS